MLLILIEIFLSGVLSGIFALGFWRTIGSPNLNAINQNAIFWEVGNWIREKAILHEDREVMRSIECQKVGSKYRRKTNWFMALGACLMCFSTWIGIILVPFAFYLFGEIHNYFLLPLLSIAGGLISSVIAIKLDIKT